MIGIYKITSPTKKVYIGQSINIERRFKIYKNINQIKCQIKLYNSFLKYGVDKHKFEILCECNIDELNDKERYYQDVFSVIGKNGLNCLLTTSSNRSGKGIKHSEETKLKLSKAHKGKKMSNDSKIKMSKWQIGKKLTEVHKNKISLGLKGKITSEETKRKISLANKGRIFSKESIENISNSQKKIILNLETGIFYLGRKEAAYSISINVNTLNNHLIGKTKNKTPFIYC
jgi:group I intron endonuclease